MGYSLNKIALLRPEIIHQRIARNIVINFFNSKGFSHFEAFQEGLADYDNNNCELVCDVVFADKKTNKVAVAIEIANSEKSNSQHHKGIIEDLYNIYNISEVFLYNYEIHEWTCMSAKGYENGNSFSEILDIDMNSLIHVNSF